MTAEVLKTVLLYGGIPGMALLVFWLLLKGFGFKFDNIPPVWSAIVAIVFLLVIAFIVNQALTRFEAPKPAQVLHMGELQNLVAHLKRDSTSGVSINFGGTAEEKTALGTMYVQETIAPDYVSLIKKVCEANTCIKCDVGDEVTTIRKVGDIKPACKDKDDNTVNCCV